MLRVRRVGMAAYAVILAVYCVVQGVPTDRLLQALWIVAGVAVSMLGRPWRELLRVVLDWTPFIGLLLAYDFTRGVADTLGAPLHVTGPATADEVMFRPLLDGAVPTVWLQNHLYDPLAVHWWDVIVALVYFTHFTVPWALAGILYVRDRDGWRRYAVRIVALSVAGLLTYVVFPAAPPWMASQQAVIPVGVERIATRGWSAVGLHDAGVLLTNAQAGVNQVAAMPSLHAATALLIAVVLWRRTRRRVLRAVLVAYPPAMAFALVYGGEHYVVDVLVGWVYVVAVLGAVSLGEQAVARRRDRRERPDRAPVEAELVQRTGGAV
jgi:membrane-associated phospholipid phosphatase